MYYRLSVCSCLILQYSDFFSQLAGYFSLTCRSMIDFQNSTSYILFAVSLHSRIRPFIQSCTWIGRVHFIKTYVSEYLQDSQTSNGNISDMCVGGVEQRAERDKSKQRRQHFMTRRFSNCMMKKGGYSWLVHDKIPWEKERDTRLMYIDKEFRAYQ